MRQKRIKFNWGPKMIMVLIFLLSACYTIAANKTWTGSISSDWNVGSNWGGTVPAAGDKAIIPTALTTYPIITSGTVNIRDIKITGTGSLTIKGGTVNISAKLEFHNSVSPFGIVIQSCGTLNVKDLKFTGAGKFIQNENDGTSLLTISHDYKNSSGGTFSSSGGTIQFTGSGGGGPNFSTGTNQFYNVIVDAGVNPKFDNAGGGNISVAGDFINNNSSLDVTNAEFTFNGSGDQSIYSASTPVPFTTTFGDLVINKPSGSLQLLSDAAVENRFTDTNEILDKNGYVLWAAGVPLPVELSSFSAVILQNEVKLTWRTDTEVNNYGFEILRQAQNDRWSLLGFVEGNGNSNSPKEYSFVDDNVTAGKYSYHIKQIDTDGKFEYSKTIEIDLGSPINFKLRQNYPNPFNPSTTISFSLPVSNNVSLKVFNTLGEEIVNLVESFLEPGVHTYIFNADRLTSGIYVYQLSTNDATQTRKMLYLK
jgi:hypothetical protein